MNEDNDLVYSFINGDDTAFEALVLKYRQAAIQFSIQFIHDYHIAEDIAQESFASIYVYKERFNFKSSFKTYLFTIVRNKSIDYIRKNNRVSLEEFEVIDENGAEDLIVKQEEKIYLKETMNRLKDEYKIAIYLIDYNDMSYSEAARIMGKSVVQIKVLIYRARKKLKLLLQEE
ncbi:RNA polymerase sigma-70 factor, ECF subfamily [Clostridium cavendishii DSM 21758]|uniref:RNA polymerase sigma factor n=1 Tax=Clostridium cavendishii DSM 21758 TaxID=1121302 RepID=A0A1M6SHN2_9CLOT|nr:RNA polymerase sigma factor [Clostridium cavendishii]SHK44261.1 RNA polymerase sigma-70 factor, ECF subfamily [Clostridium cavendishii DSM 21758]